MNRSYEQMAKSLKLRSPKQASNFMQTAKRRFRSTLHDVISEYEDGDVEAELKELLDILRRYIERDQRSGEDA